MSKILIVDDEQGIRTILTDIFEDESFEVRSAETGAKGLLLLNSKKYDLVVLDVWLPDINGIELLEKIIKDFPDLPVVVISGHANIDVAVKAVNLGAYDFLEKPLSIEKTITVVNNAIEISQLKNENRDLKKTLNQVPESIPVGKSLNEAIEEFEKEYIQDVIKVEKGLSEAAKKLDLKVTELEEKIRKYGLEK